MRNSIDQKIQNIKQQNRVCKTGSTKDVYAPAGSSNGSTNQVSGRIHSGNNQNF